MDEPIESRRAVLEALLAKHEDDGLESNRRTRVIYPKADGRQRIGWRERMRLLALHHRKAS